MEILLERTDDMHMLNASELCTILNQEYGISLAAFAKKTFGMYGGVDLEIVP